MKASEIMKKAFIKLFALLLSILTTAATANAVSTGFTLSDRCEPNTMVTVDVFSPDGDIVYRNQKTSDADGEFSFDIGIDEGKGEYKANVYCDGEEAKRTYNINNKYDKAQIDEDFELNSEWSMWGSSAVIAASDADHGSSLILKPTGSNVGATKKISTSVNSGVWMLKFDIMADSTENYTYLNFYGVNNKGESLTDHVICLNNKGVLGYFDKLDSFDWTAEKICEYNAGLWYNCAVWLDFDNRIVSFVVRDENNNEYKDECMMNSAFDTVNKIGVTTEKITGGSVYLDNVYLKQISYGEMEYNNAPEYLQKAVQIKNNIGTFGNIFYGKRNMLNVSFDNKSEYELNCIAKYTILDKNGDTVKTVDKNILLASDCITIDQMDIALPKYGLYTLKVELSREDSSEVYEKEIAFSYCVSAEKNSQFGVVTHISSDGTDPVQYAELISDAGFSYVRTEICWEDFEKVKYDYKIPEKEDKYISELCNSGIEPLVICAFFNELYGDSSLTSDELTGFKNYCYELATKLKGRVKYFEIWNEFDLVGNAEFNPKSLDAKAYAKLLKAGYEGIKDANKDTVVMGMVTSAVNDTKVAWIKEVLDALNGEKAFDVISVHPYNIYSYPEVENGYANLYKLKALMDEYEIDVPVWATEMGWTTSAVKPGVSDEIQAGYMTRFALLNSKNKLLEKIFWYGLQDDNNDENSDWGNFGMLENQLYARDINAAKPAYLAMNAYNTIMKDAEFVSDLTGDSTRIYNRNYAFEYLSGRGNPLYTLWAPNPEWTDYELTLPEGVAVLYDMYGNETVISTTGGKVTVDTSPYPVYIEVFDDYATLKLYQDGIINAEGYTRTNNSEAFLGVYDKASGKLKEVQVLDKQQMQTNMQHINKALEYAEDEAIKLFLWDANQHPLVKSIKF